MAEKKEYKNEKVQEKEEQVSLTLDKDEEEKELERYSELYTIETE